MTDIKPIVPVTLNVARVGRDGNTGGGAYFFDFNPHPVPITLHDTTLVFELSVNTPAGIVIDQLISSDALGQLGTPVIAPSLRSVSVGCKNVLPYLIQVAILVTDRDNNQTFVCDPQVICRPPPPTR